MEKLLSSTQIFESLYLCNLMHGMNVDIQSIKSNHLFMQKKNNIYEFNLLKSQYVKYYFPQQANSIAWGCFSWAPLLTKFFN